MSEFINGVKVTINMIEKDTTYQEQYGKMIPGKSKVSLEVIYEIEKRDKYFIGRVEFGKYISYISYMPFVEKVKIENYDDNWLLMETNILYDTGNNGNIIVKMYSREVLSKEYDPKNSDEYIIATSKELYFVTEDIHKFSFSLFNMYPWIFPKIDFINAERNTSKNKVMLTLKVMVYLKNELFNDHNIFKLHIKEQTESIYQELIVLDDCEISYNHSPDFINGELYDDFINITISNISSNTHNAFFKFYVFDDFIEYPMFIIPAAYQLLCFGNDGHSIAFGKKCEQPGFENNLDSWFYKPTHFTSSVNFKVPPIGIPSDNIIINKIITNNNIVEMGFAESELTNDTIIADNLHYKYKAQMQLNPTLFGMTVDQMLNESICEVFFNTQTIGICPRVYLLDQGNNIIQFCMLFRYPTITEDIPIKIRFSLCDTFND